MTSSTRHTPPPSATRRRLCSREHALRVAERVFEERDRPVAIVRTGDPLQPFRVDTGDEHGGIVELEIVCR